MCELQIPGTIPDMNIHLSLELSSLPCLAPNLHSMLDNSSELRQGQLLSDSRGCTDS